MNLYVLSVLLLIHVANVTSEKLFYNFELDLGGIPFNNDSGSMIHNTKLFSKFLQTNATGNALVIPDKTFFFYPGVYGSGIHDFDLLVNGTIRFQRGITDTNHYDKPEPCILFEDSSNLYITGHIRDEADPRQGITDDIDFDYASSKRGVIDGYGAEYWGIPLIGYVQLGEFRPDLFAMNRTENVLIEYMTFRDAALYTLHLDDMNGLEVRYVSVIARRTHTDGHGLMDLSAFNTDGIDVSGNNVHIHDVDIWNQDDCIAVKDAPQSGVSSNMLFERVTASGLGLTIGSIGGTTVRNITFRDSLLYKTYKGIYIKFRPDPWRSTPGLIEDVLYENITMIEPEQWAIFVGPAQQSISANPCKASPCSLCWPTIPGQICDGIKERTFRRIVLKNVKIYNPLGSPGVILADEYNPIDGITFEDVIVERTVPEIYRGIKEELFPGLQEPINDLYTPFTLWIVIAAFCAILVSSFIISFLLISKILSIPSKSMKMKEPSTTLRTRIMIGITVLLAVLVQNVIRTSEERLVLDRYFTCSGVKNGYAYGHTSPIPHCFEDFTNKKQS